LKLFQEWGEEEIKEKDVKGEFTYDTFDIVYELLRMPQCTTTQHNNKKMSLYKKRMYV
jgi:hypothetical protein